MSGFWSTLLFQTSLNEPAVFHAILALSSVHKSGVMKTSKEHDLFTWEHYMKAISHLQPHFSPKRNDQTSVRVALITCVVFVSLEFLRGHFETAQTHLRNGIKILRQREICSNEQQEGFLHFQSRREPADDSIVEVFSRLHLQVELFKISYHHPRTIILDAELDDPVSRFNSTNAAWKQMERLLNKILYFTHEARRQAASQPGVYRPSEEVIDYQQRVQADLARWHNMYTTFRQNVEHGRPGKPEKYFLDTHSEVDIQRGYQLIATYHTMAKIMADTCLHPNDESIYDSHTDQFILLGEQFVMLRGRVGPEPSFSHSHLGSPATMSDSIIDIGGIPLLYYLATKCRVHCIRLQAIKLLESITHREGIWDARIAACVARKVMEVEENDFYSKFNTMDNFPINESPTFYDLSLPTLPDAYRMREVEVVLSGNPMEKILLFCKRQQDGVYVRVLVSEYDVGMQCWVDLDLVC